MLNNSIAFVKQHLVLLFLLNQILNVSLQRVLIQLSISYIALDETLLNYILILLGTGAHEVYDVSIDSSLGAFIKKREAGILDFIRLVVNDDKVKIT